VSAGGDRLEVSPALYTSLEVDSAAASHDEVAAAEAAMAAVSADRADADIAAVAYVRGTASPETAQAWRSARKRLRDKLAADGLDPVEALTGQGWDFATGVDMITFWSAAPPGHTERRRAEKSTASNVGSRYVVVP
jgi:hypothetical protein